MVTFSALLALCEGIQSVTGGFPSKRTSNADVDDFFDVSLNKRLHKQSGAGELRRYDGHCDVTVMITEAHIVVSTDWLCQLLTRDFTGMGTTMHFS